MVFNYDKATGKVGSNKNNLENALTEVKDFFLKKQDIEKPYTLSKDEYSFFERMKKELSDSQLNGSAEDSKDAMLQLAEEITGADSSLVKYIQDTDVASVSQVGFAQSQKTVIQGTTKFSAVMKTAGGVAKSFVAKTTVRGDIIANNLVLGADVKIKESNIGDLTNYITTNGLENKLKDYSTTEEIKSGGLAFIVSNNGEIGNYDSSMPLPDNTEGYFRVNTKGLMVAQNAVIYGKLYSSEGLIAGWNITGDALSKGSGYAVANTSSSKNAYFGNSGLSISDKFIVDSEGNVNAKSGTFSGTIYASAGTFSGELKAATGSFNGNITASTGSIGPWNINSDAIYKGNGYNAGGPGNAYFGNSGLSVSDKFIVDSNGNMNATDATISGTITASSGKIGLFNISNDGSIYNKPYGTAGSGSVCAIKIFI